MGRPDIHCPPPQYPKKKNFPPTAFVLGSRSLHLKTPRASSPSPQRPNRLRGSLRKHHLLGFPWPFLISLAFPPFFSLSSLLRELSKPQSWSNSKDIRLSITMAQIRSMEARVGRKNQREFSLMSLCGCARGGIPSPLRLHCPCVPWL